MSFFTEALRFLCRGGLLANITAVNEVPLRRELVVAIDARDLRVGDGVTNWASLTNLLAQTKPGFQYTVETANTTDSDPGSGLVKWNNATQSSATFLYFDDATADTSTDLSAFFTELAASSTTGIVHFMFEGGAFKVYKWTAVTDGTGYFKFAVSHLVSSGGNFSDGSIVRVTFLPMPTGGAGGSTWTLVKKTADTTRTSTTTVTDDPHLTFACAAGTRYRVKIRVTFSTDATPDFKFILAFSGTQTGTDTATRKHMAPAASIGSGNISAVGSTGIINASIAPTSTNSGIGFVEYDVIFVTNSSGTFSFQWAQNTSSANNTTVLAGSYLEYATF